MILSLRSPLGRPLIHPLAAVLLTFAPAAALAGVDIPGIDNFRQVTDAVYRGGQPSDASWEQLAQMGVRTVIDLRQKSEHSTAVEARLVEAAGMRYVNVPMDGFQTPTSAQMDSVLQWMTPGDPVFIHCKRGRDRTGTVIAAYRISYQGWENQRALDEALTCGMQWFSRGMKQFIRGYKPSDMLLARAVKPVDATPAAVPVTTP